MSNMNFEQAALQHYIQKLVAITGTTEEALMSKRGPAAEAAPRHLLRYLLVEKNNLSEATVSKLLGQHRSSISNSVEVVRHDLALKNGDYRYEKFIKPYSLEDYFESSFQKELSSFPVDTDDLHLYGFKLGAEFARDLLLKKANG
jgi:hypothetical protein